MGIQGQQTKKFLSCVGAELEFFSDKFGFGDSKRIFISLPQPAKIFLLLCTMAHQSPNIPPSIKFLSCTESSLEIFYSPKIRNCKKIFPRQVCLCIHRAEQSLGGQGA